MSNFICEKCKAFIMDSPHGYLTGCEHYPRFTRRQKPTKKDTKEIEKMKKLLNLY